MYRTGLAQTSLVLALGTLSLTEAREGDADVVAF